MLTLVLRIAVVVVGAVAIYLSRWPNRVVDVASSPVGRSAVVALRVVGPVMVAVGLLSLYLDYVLNSEGFGR